MVERQGHFYSVDALLAPQHERPRIIYEDVQSLVAGFECLRELPDGVLRRQVGDYVVHVWIAGLPQDLLHGHRSALLTAPHQDQIRPQLGQLKRRGLSNAGSGACD